MKAAQEAFALEYIHKIRAIGHGIGGMKLWCMYRNEFPDIDRLGRDRFEDLIYRNNLKVRNKARKPRTTDSSHGLPVFPNLVFSFIPTGINQLWVSDITYIPVWLSDDGYTFCYLSVVTDAYSHEIIGRCVGPTLETLYPHEALGMALKRLEGMEGSEIEKLVHHSDRGVHYASREYVATLRQKHVRISMTENGNPKDNAIAERINLTVKDELLKGIRFKCLREVGDSLAIAVDFYNKRRPHRSLDMMTPEQAAKCNGEIKKWWKSYLDEAIKNGRAWNNP